MEETHSLKCWEQCNDINLIGMYLAQRDIKELSLDELGSPADFVVLNGSSLLEPLRMAVACVRSGIAKQLFIVGGIGHSTPTLYHNVSHHTVYKNVATQGRAESEILADIAISHLNLSEHLIVIEKNSTNCGNNATEARKILDNIGISPEKMLIIQDPTMQRRSMLCYRRAWRDIGTVQLISFAPFIPKVTANDDNVLALNQNCRSTWPIWRYIELLLGEVVRLRDDEHGYGPRGKDFIDHVEIPPEIQAAFDRLVKRYPVRLV